jgi:hypothetical protein
MDRTDEIVNLASMLTDSDAARDDLLEILAAAVSHLGEMEQAQILGMIIVACIAADKVPRWSAI